MWCHFFLTLFILCLIFFAIHEWLQKFSGTEAERNSVTSRKVSNLKYADVPDGLSNYWAAVNSLLSQAI